MSSDSSPSLSSGWEKMAFLSNKFHSRSLGSIDIPVNPLTNISSTSLDGPHELGFVEAEVPSRTPTVNEISYCVLNYKIDSQVRTFLKWWDNAQNYRDQPQKYPFPFYPHRSKSHFLMLFRLNPFNSPKIFFRQLFPCTKHSFCHNARGRTCDYKLECSVRTPIKLTSMYHLQ